MTIKEIATHTDKSESAVKVYMLRHGYPTKKQVECPIMEKLIKIKFACPNWFRPDRGFYKEARISQKRFTDLRMGYAQPTADELKRVAKVINVSTDDLLQLYQDRQLSLFPD